MVATVYNIRYHCKFISLDNTSIFILVQFWMYNTWPWSIIGFLECLREKSPRASIDWTLYTNISTGRKLKFPGAVLVKEMYSTYTYRISDKFSEPGKSHINFPVHIQFSDIAQGTLYCINFTISCACRGHAADMSCTNFPCGAVHMECPCTFNSFCKTVLVIAMQCM